MKRILSILAAVASTFAAAAQPAGGYQTLDPSNPVVFGGNHIVWQGEKIVLGPHAFFLDGRLSDAVADRHPFVFNTIQAAAAALTDGTEAEPMTLYIAPWVYWADDPDDPAIRKTEPGVRGPFGMEIACEWLRFHGLTGDPANVVLACNRGQTHGSEGNFTMFNIRGNGLSAENVTFGNYCNIDLEFPLDPSLNRKRRADAIVQAQLVFSNADRAWARNTRFVSRLNLCPFSGARRLLFDRCYFECTDDALAGTAVYLDSRFTFYSSRPFYATQGTGAVFLNCDFDILTPGRQYFTKADSPVTVVDSRFHAPSDSLYIGWSGAPRESVYSYQYNVRLNGKPLLINGRIPEQTIDMSGKPILNAYRLETPRGVVYNTYNLLRGDDDWDPMGVKEAVLAAGKEFANIPTFLQITPASGQIESGANTVRLTAVEQRFGRYPAEAAPVAWDAPGDRLSLIRLRPADDTFTCDVEGTNEQDETRTLKVTASTPSGLQSAGLLTVAPAFVDPPAFTRPPRIVTARRGLLSVSYGLALGNRLDESLITWYRCADAQGNDPIEVAVSRLNRPALTYELTPGDDGHYIMAVVQPKHLRSHPGEARSTVRPEPVRPNEIAKSNFSTDFRTFPSANQPRILPGTWTLDRFKPADTDYYDWSAEPKTGIDNWAYMEGIDGSAGIYGLAHIAKGARMLYTPVDGDYGDMAVTIEAAPGKSAGQGFGSATGQYMDVFIKYDTRSLTGYGLRIIRTPKYGDAVDFILMEYTNGLSRELTEPVSSDAYLTTCTIHLETRDGKLTARAQTDAPPRAPRPDVVHSVSLEADIAPSAFGGAGIQHTGSTGAGSTWLREMDIVWK